MPTYKLPKAKKSKPKKGDMCLAHDETEWRRRISIPINADIMEVMAVDAEVVITIKGKVKELRSFEGDKSEDRSMEVYADEIEAYPSDYEDEEDFKKSYS